MTDRTLTEIFAPGRRYVLREPLRYRVEGSPDDLIVSVFWLSFSTIAEQAELDEAVSVHFDSRYRRLVEIPPHTLTASDLRRANDLRALVERVEVTR